MAKLQNKKNKKKLFDEMDLYTFPFPIIVNLPAGEYTILRSFIPVDIIPEFCETEFYYEKVKILIPKKEVIK